MGRAGLVVAWRPSAVVAAVVVAELAAGASSASVASVDVAGLVVELVAGLAAAVAAAAFDPVAAVVSAEVVDFGWESVAEDFGSEPEVWDANWVEAVVLARQRVVADVGWDAATVQQALEDQDPRGLATEISFVVPDEVVDWAVPGLVVGSGCFAGRRRAAWQCDA